MDKRTKRYRTYRVVKEYIFSKEMLCTLIVTFFAICILWNSLKHPEKPLLDPRGQTKVLEVVKVEAIENTPTPTPSKGRRYLKYSRAKYYPEIISKLQKMYVNWEDAADLQSYENGFNPYAINPTSGACGLSQALPCKKMDCKLGDIDCDLNWQKEYISGRYGTVSKTLQFWRLNGWY